MDSASLFRGTPLQETSQDGVGGSAEDGEEVLSSPSPQKSRSGPGDQLGNCAPAGACLLLPWCVCCMRAAGPGEALLWNVL